MNKKVIPLLVAGLILIPTAVEAKSFSSGARSSVSRPSTSMSRPSSSSISRPSTSSIKSSSPKPTSLKSGTSTMKPSSSNSSKSIPRTNTSTKSNSSTKTTTNKTNTVDTKKTTTTAPKTDAKKTETKLDLNKDKLDLTKKPEATKATDTTKKVETKKTESTTKEIKKEVKPDAKTNTTSSYNYSVKPKSTIKYVNTKPSYYSGYSSQPIHYNNGLSFWDVYLLNNMMNSGNKKEEVTERDIARELESRGYTKTEVDKILAEGKEEQAKFDKKKKEELSHSQKEEKKTNYIKYGLITATLAGLGGIGYLFMRSGKEK